MHISIIIYTFALSKEKQKRIKKGGIMEDKVYITETTLQRDDLDDLVPTIRDLSDLGFNYGDKVKVIVIKVNNIVEDK